MKKIICMLLALLLLVGCVFTFASCIEDDSKNDEKNEQENDKKQEGEDNKEEEKEEDKKDEIVIPEGYVAYNDGKISFAYPKDWSKQSGSVSILQTLNGNNITVAYEEKSDMYVNMTIETYNSTLKPVYEAMGMMVSNVKIEKKETNGLQIVQISQTTSINGVTMTQTQYILPIEDLNYVVTVTEVVADAALRETVLNTLTVVK